SDANRTNNPLSVAIFDIDDFKKVNDSKGHIYGDQVLIDVAANIKNSIRISDVAGRYGGEEFMVIFPNTDLETATKISERIRQAIESYSFVDGLKITISGGIKEYEREDMTELINLADKNLYKAKKNGKNQIVF
ncbi:MAG: GGDEF domain-containing protein, partial [Synergistaceae bacterium]|nr:GGDEF domain-containing protein [Synergistaceae bacterium]